MATISTVPVYWLEARNQWIAKSTEYYKGETITVSGASRLGKAEARKAWKRNYDKRVAVINTTSDRKNWKVKLDVALPDWYEQYKEHDGRTLDTVRTDKDTIRQLVAALGTLRVCDIDSDVIQRYVNKLAMDKSNSIIKKRWNMLHMFFVYAYPENNPMVRCTRTPSQVQAHTWMINDDESMNKLAYTAAEQASLAAELSKPYNVHSGWHTGDRGYSTGIPVIVCMYQFMRVGEVIELRVKDVLWNDEKTGGYIWIRRQYDEYHKITKPPKYESARKVPIMKECVEILRNACDGKHLNDLLFASGMVYNPDKITHEGRLLRGRLRDNLNAACDRVGLQRHTIHDLRHDGISRLVDMGVQPQSVKKWAGHKSLTVTLDQYYRHSKEDNANDLALVCEN